MKFVIILGSGRSGTELLQSLFDNHPQILQFPGILRFNQSFVNILDEKNPHEISQKFYDLYPRFFDSRIQDPLQPNVFMMERHHMLGKNKKSFYKVNRYIFEKNFIYYFNNSKKKKIDIIISLHKAYAKAARQTLVNKKIIILDLHIIQYLKNFEKTFNKFNNFKILLTLRDPLVSLSSVVNHWLQFRSGKYLFAESIYDNIKTHIDTFNYLHKFRKKVFVVQLENLHLKSNKVLKDLCKLLKINFRISLKKSTYFNKIWWGDQISKKFLNGLNPKFKNNFDKNIFFKKDIAIIEAKIKNILINYNYPIRSNSQIKNKYIALLPFKFELIVWYNSFKIRDFKKLLLIPFYLIRRQMVFFRKNLYDKNKLPYSVGTKN